MGRKITVGVQCTYRVVAVDGRQFKISTDESDPSHQNSFSTWLSIVLPWLEHRFPQSKCKWRN